MDKEDTVYNGIEYNVSVKNAIGILIVIALNL